MIFLIYKTAGQTPNAQKTRLRIGGDNNFIPFYPFCQPFRELILEVL
nr:MAG TPA: hypothetical protein [Siphoviridae sp. ct7JV2]